jgi:hypothetical protein
MIQASSALGAPGSRFGAVHRGRGTLPEQERDQPIPVRPANLDHARAGSDRLTFAPSSQAAEPFG